jgi:hypothetical protein
MTPDLRRLLIDHIRRGGWFWLAVGFVQVSATLGYAETPRLLTHISYPMIGVLFAPMILGTAQQRGWFQILMTLPLSRRDIGHARWWAAIGLPGIFLTGVSVLVIFCFAALGWQRRSSWQIALWLLNGWAILGLWTQAQSWLRVPVGGGRWPSARFIVAAIYVALAIPSLFLASRDDIWAQLAIGTTAAGLLVDVYLYVRADDLLLWQVGRARAAERGPAKVAPVSHVFGWGVLAKQLALRLAIFAVLVALFLGAFGILFVGEGVEFSFLPMSFMGFMVVLSCFLATPWLSAARAFRSLPLTADRLAATFLVMTMAPAWMVLLTVFAVGLFFPDAAILPRAPFSLLSIAMAALFVPILLSSGQRAMAWTAILIIVPSPILDPMVTIFHPDLLDAWMRGWVSLIVVVLAAIIGIVSYLWTRHELRSGRNAYRPVTLLSANVAV